MKEKAYLITLTLCMFKRSITKRNRWHHCAHVSASFRATKKRPTRVIARLCYKDLLFFKRN